VITADANQVLSRPPIGAQHPRTPRLPAPDTPKASVLGWSRPKSKRLSLPVKIIRSGMITVPTMSTWTSGLRRMRPKDRAVVSPCRSAVHAWADSWTWRLNSRTTYEVRPKAMVWAVRTGSFERTKTSC
jgi:hypothetical protein